jgi:ribonuclease BN (tRNA processing enzyme)
MRMTVLGGCGGWPGAGQACSGYLVEHDGFRALVDPGYATLPRLLSMVTADDVDAALVSHGHPDHCADLHPLLRARAFRDDPAPPLPVYSLPGAVDAVLALDRPGALAGAAELRPFAGGDRFDVGPFQVETRALPHMVPNVGIRLAVDGQVLVYTGDTGQSPDIVELARDADVFLAEASYPENLPASLTGALSTAREAGRNAVRAGAGRLVLTHLMPGQDPGPAVAAAQAAFGGPIDVAVPHLVVGERP